MNDVSNSERLTKPNIACSCDCFPGPHEPRSCAQFMGSVEPEQASIHHDDCVDGCCEPKQATQATDPDAPGFCPPYVASSAADAEPLQHSTTNMPPRCCKAGHDHGAATERARIRRIVEKQFGDRAAHILAIIDGGLTDA